jgi:hypothetical protein
METEFEATSRLEYTNDRVQLVVYIGHLSTRPVAEPEQDVSYSTLAWRLLLLMAVIFIVQNVYVFCYTEMGRTVLSTMVVNVATTLHDFAQVLT